MEALLPTHVLHGDDDCNQCVTTGAASRGMLGLWWPLRAPHAPHASCCIWLCCTVTVAVLGGLVCAQSRGAVPSHATDPASAFTFPGAVGDGRASFGSMRGEAVHANAAHFSSVASPWALPSGSDASAPPVDLVHLVQLTAWIKALSELVQMQDGADSRFVDARERAMSVLESWVQQWYDRQAMSTP